MTAYPTTITYLDAASFTESQEDVSIASQAMEGGYTLSRPKFTRAPRRTFSFNYVDMSQASHITLQAFWDTVKGKSNLFTWVHPITAVTYNVRFGMDNLSFKRVGFANNHRWESNGIVLVEV